jgi:4-amino-4-deoxy-L-arabinose transferase-like glycosyltransferase
MLGLLALPLVWRDAPISRASRRDLLTLVVFALLFTLALSLFSKKLNRYIMPAFPALNILAAAGLVWGGDKLRRLLCRGREGRLCAPHVVSTALIGIVGALALFNVAWWHPYSIAYFNQALGGAQAGPRVFLIGHGEGLEQAAAWLNQQSDITGVVAATTMKPALQPYLRHGAQASPRDGEELPRATGYVVVYVRNVWDGAVPPFDRFYQQVPPLHTVTIHGVEYAWIYEVPPSIEREINVEFGQGIELHGYDIDSSALRATGVLSLTTQWHATAPLADEYLMFTHLIDDEGQRVAQIDAPPAGADAPTPSWQAGRYRTWVHPIPVPPDLPPGDYWLALGIYRPEDFSRLPVSAEPPPDAPTAGGNALLLPLELDE